MNQELTHLHDATNDAAIRGSYLAPDHQTKQPFVDWELGGIAIQDPSKGLTYQLWTVRWDPGTNVVTLQAARTGVAVELFTEQAVTDIALSFDQNMRWCVATRVAGGVNLRWYDSSANAYVITEFPGASSPRLALDDKRDEQVNMGVTDIVLTFIRAQKVYWYLQRDRFLVEHSHPTVFPAGTVIRRFGMTDKLRLQWEMETT